MITLDGKTHIKRYLAAFVPAIARSIAFGIGDRDESSSDRKLQFEAGRVDVSLTTYDFINNKLIFKSGLPTDFSGVINEVAIYSAATDTIAGQYGSQLLTTFDSATENWIDTTSGADSEFSSTNQRLGADALRQAPAASATKSDSLTDVFLDLGGYSAADVFVFAFNVGNDNTTGIKFNFLTDSANYYTIPFGAQTTGYKIVEATKGSATTTGSPDWANITQIKIDTTSGSGGGSQIDFDGIRIDDADTINPDYVMVSRNKLDASMTKTEGRANEIEFAIDITI